MLDLAIPPRQMTPGDLGRMTDVELISDTYLARVCIEAGFTSRLDIYELLRACLVILCVDETMF